LQKESLRNGSIKLHKEVWSNNRCCFLRFWKTQFGKMYCQISSNWRMHRTQCRAYQKDGNTWKVTIPKMTNVPKMCIFLQWCQIFSSTFAKLVYWLGLTKEISKEGWTSDWVLNLTWIKLFGLYVIRKKGKMFCPWGFATRFFKFWINNTQVSPNMKDVVRRWLVQKSWESHLAHLLLESKVWCFYTWHTVNATLSLLTPHVSTFV
jgi:hypothetical protein